jgi:hypothetical protein
MSTNEPEPWAISDEEFMAWLKAAADALSRVDITALTDDELREHLGVVSSLMRLVDRQLNRVAESVRERGFSIDDEPVAAEPADVADEEPPDLPEPRPRGKAPP